MTGPQDDDGSGVTLAVALRADPEYPAATAATTTAATPSANSENFLLNAPSSIVRPDVSLYRGKTLLPASREYFAVKPAFQGGSVRFGMGDTRAYNGFCPRRWRNWSTRWPQKPLSFGTCGFESHPPHQTVDHTRAARHEPI